MLESLGLNGIRAVIGAIFFPVLSFYLSPAELGLVGLFLGINAFMGPLIAGNLENLSWKKKFDKGDFKTFKIVVIQLTIILALIFVSLVLIFSDFFRDKVGNTYLLQPLIALLDTWIVIKSVDFFSEHKHRQGNFLTISKQLLILVLTILLLELVIENYQARIYGQLITAVALGTYALRSYLNDSTVNDFFRLKKGHYKGVITFMLMGYPGLIFAWVIFHSDKFFIEEIVGRQELGIYTMAYALSNVVYVADSAISQVWSSHYYKMADENKVKKIYMGIGIQAGLITLIAVILSLMTPLIYQYVIDSSYVKGTSIVPFIAFAYVFFSISDKFKLFIIKSERAGWTTVNNGIAAAINIALNILLIRKYGIMGAAYSTIISYFVLMLLNMVVGIKLFNIYHKNKKFQPASESV